MATSRPISNISYNSEDFLLEKLEEWYDAHLIQAYQYIKHKGEDGDEDHIHLRIEPNQRLDPMDLTEELKEYDPNHPKPKGVLTWRPSSEADWCLYVLHDPDYLKFTDSDSEDGKIPYSIEDMVVSENYDKEVLYIRSRQKLKNTSACITKQLREGRRALDLVSEGRNVFQVRGCLQVLKETEYEKKCKEYEELSHEYDRIIQAIKDFGLELVPDPVDDDKLILKEI